MARKTTRRIAALDGASPAAEPSAKASAGKGGRKKRARDPERRHPGVELLKPYPRHGRPFWRLKWRLADGSSDYKTLGALALDDREGAEREAHKVSRELVAQKHTPLSGITLHEAMRLYTVEGKRRQRPNPKKGKERSGKHAISTSDAIRDSIEALNAFLLARGAKHLALPNAPKSAYVDELRRIVDHRTLLAQWVAHEYDRPARGRGGRPRLSSSVQVTLKWVHAVLRHLKLADETRVFDTAFLQAAVPVKSTAAESPGRMLIDDEPRRLLESAMLDDTGTELPSAALALMFLATTRRFETAYLQCKHVAVDMSVRLHAKRRGVAILLPAWLDEQRTCAHAKGAEKRIIAFGYRDPGETTYRGLSPLGAELVAALAHKRRPNTWLVCGDYERLETYMRRAAKRAGIEGVSLQDLRVTSANHVREMIGNERAAQRNGHTEQVMEENYIDSDHVLDMTERPASLEASIGIEDQLRAIIARVRLHARGWSEPRPLPTIRLPRRRSDDSAAQATQ